MCSGALGSPLWASICKPTSTRVLLNEALGLALPFLCSSLLGVHLTEALVCVALQVRTFD